MAQIHDTKQRLLETAQKLFYARSYEDVGVQDKVVALHLLLIMVRAILDSTSI